MITPTNIILSMRLRISVKLLLIAVALALTQYAEAASDADFSKFAGAKRRRVVPKHWVRVARDSQEYETLRLPRIGDKVTAPGRSTLCEMCSGTGLPTGWETAHANGTPYYWKTEWELTRETQWERPSGSCETCTAVGTVTLVHRRDPCAPPSYWIKFDDEEDELEYAANELSILPTDSTCEACNGTGQIAGMGDCDLCKQTADHRKADGAVPRKARGFNYEPADWEKLSHSGNEYYYNIKTHVVQPIRYHPADWQRIFHGNGLYNYLNNETGEIQASDWAESQQMKSIDWQELRRRTSNLIE